MVGGVVAPPPGPGVSGAAPPAGTQPQRLGAQPPLAGPRVAPPLARREPARRRPLPPARAPPDAIRGRAPPFPARRALVASTATWMPRPPVGRNIAPPRPRGREKPLEREVGGARAIPRRPPPRRGATPRAVVLDAARKALPTENTAPLGPTLVTVLTENRARVIAEAEPRVATEAMGRNRPAATARATPYRRTATAETGCGVLGGAAR